MKKADTPAFASVALQEAFRKGRPVFERVEEVRNQVSNDIKLLEAYLQDIDLKTPFFFAFSHGHGRSRRRTIWQCY